MTNINEDCGHCLTPEDRCSDESDRNCMPAEKRERVKCPRCDGFGSIANPAFDGMSTSEMRDDMGDEETDEFLSEYTRHGGMYDVLCPCCNGSKVIALWQVDEFNDREEMYREMEAEQRMMGMGNY